MHSVREDLWINIYVPGSRRQGIRARVSHRTIGKVRILAGKLHEIAKHDAIVESGSVNSSNCDAVASINVCHHCAVYQGAAICRGTAIIRIISDKRAVLELALVHPAAEGKSAELVVMKQFVRAQSSAPPPDPVTGNGVFGEPGPVVVLPVRVQLFSATKKAPPP